jgi:hypothetical protein
VTPPKTEVLDLVPSSEGNWAQNDDNFGSLVRLQILGHWRKRLWEPYCSAFRLGQKNLRWQRMGGREQHRKATHKFNGWVFSVWPYVSKSWVLIQTLGNKTAAGSGSLAIKWTPTLLLTQHLVSVYKKLCIYMPLPLDGEHNPVLSTCMVSHCSPSWEDA